MRGLKATLLLAGTGAAALAIAMTAAQPQPANVSVFTADQATVGATAYATACARCHQPDLRGSMDAPPLSGTNFFNAWRGRSTADLYNKIITSMPVDNPGSLPEQAVNSIVAFILRQNGATPGTQAFARTTAVQIGQVATGAAPPAQQAAAAPPAAAGRARAHPRGAHARGQHPELRARDRRHAARIPLPPIG